MRPVLLITGATSTIGTALARRMAATHDLALATRSRRQEAESLADELQAQVSVHPSDLSDLSTIPALIASVLEAHGRIDGLALVSGDFAPHDPLTTDMAPALRQMTVNTLAPMALVSAAAPHMAEGGAVVAVSSVNAEAAPPGAAAFAASKAGLEGAVRAMARDHAPRGIRVNAVQPGAVERDRAPHPPEAVAAFTAQTWLGRIATPDEIAAPIAFLLSEDARWITGEVLRVAGGFRR